MEILISLDEFDKLSSRSPIKIKCINCQSIFIRNKHRVQYHKKQGNLSGAFCSQECSTEYKNKRNHIYLECKFCNTPLIRTKSDLNESNNAFCSSRCSGRYFAQFTKSQPLKLECGYCHKSFERMPYNIIKTNKYHFCSRECGMKNRGCESSKIVKCDNCGKNVKKFASSLKSHKYHFCNKSCQAIYGNKTYNRKSRFGINKSRAESRLVEIIKKDFPNLYIKENDRTILNGLELDLYIPDKNIGIELNGPCHYIPIFGNKELLKTKNKDIIKKETMQNLKIHFFQINIMSAGKKLPEILNNAYQQYIKPLLI
jgi:endogenous inhibitor of DNA gyrase (YacG/DUF329 family)